MQIRSKRQFLASWQAGLLGNRPRVWTDVATALASGASRVGFRELGRPNGQHEIVARQAILATAARWRAEGRAFFIDEAAPDDQVQLQGEMCRSVRGLEGFLAVRSGRPMRHAMRDGLLRPRSSTEVLALLDVFVDPSSKEDLLALVYDWYPDATVEFASYPMDVGIIPGRNTLIWEVRDY